MNTDCPFYCIGDFLFCFTQLYVRTEYVEGFEDYYAQYDNC